ncbi:MAG: hypothetical protein ACTSVB_05600 [Candidatus Heimdallarchaeaceae archaeon]
MNKEEKVREEVKQEVEGEVLIAPEPEEAPEPEFAFELVVRKNLNGELNFFITNGTQKEVSFYEIIAVLENAKLELFGRGVSNSVLSMLLPSSGDKKEDKKTSSVPKSKSKKFKPKK